MVNKSLSIGFHPFNCLPIDRWMPPWWFQLSKASCLCRELSELSEHLLGGDHDQAEGQVCGHFIPRIVFYGAMVLT